MYGKEEVLDLLDKQKINYTCLNHPPVYTMEEMEELHFANEECVAKNLFLRDDAHRNYYLLVVRGSTRINLKEIRVLLHSRPLSFASETDLMNYLGLTKGSVTPLGLLNDTENNVRFVLDESFRGEMIGVHPMKNDATVFLNTNDLCQLLQTHTPTWIKLLQ